MRTPPVLDGGDDESPGRTLITEKETDMSENRREKLSGLSRKEMVNGMITPYQRWMAAFAVRLICVHLLLMVSLARLNRAILHFALVLQAVMRLKIQLKHLTV